MASHSRTKATPPAPLTMQIDGFYYDFDFDVGVASDPCANLRRRDDTASWPSTHTDSVCVDGVYIDKGMFYVPTPLTRGGWRVFDAGTSYTIEPLVSRLRIVDTPMSSMDTGVRSPTSDAADTASRAKRAQAIARRAEQRARTRAMRASVRRR